MIDWFLVFNTTFSNNSAISWHPFLVVEEAGVHGPTNINVIAINIRCNKT